MSLIGVTFTAISDQAGGVDVEEEQISRKCNYVCVSAFLMTLGQMRRNSEERTWEKVGFKRFFSPRV